MELPVLPKEIRTKLWDSKWKLEASGNYREIWKKGNAKIEVFGVGKAQGSGNLEILAEAMRILEIGGTENGHDDD